MRTDHPSLSRRDFLAAGAAGLSAAALGASARGDASCIFLML
ncbi:MAG: twin-arginine translocation signal domain-containing protein, partial [Gemmataceae bacterium]|nr:twin-arginine translocation signal domain-containing protein [Gemmataceae bacterium]